MEVEPMKRKKFNLAACVIASLALAIPIPIVIANAVSKSSIEVVDDPVEFEDPNELVTDMNTPYKAKEDSGDIVVPKKVILHYHNDDNGCLSRRFYTWVTGVDGVERKPDSTAEWTSTDMAITLDFTTLTDYADAVSLFFIIKVAGTWAGQSEDTELKYEEFGHLTNEDGVLEVWTIPGEGTSIEIYGSEEETKFPKIQTAKFTDFKTIHCVSTVDAEGKHWIPKEYKLYAYDKNFLIGSESYQQSHKDFYLFKKGVPSSSEFDITFNYTAKINVQYVIESIFPGYEDRTQRVIVSYENLYENPRFEQYYTYSGDDLGVTYTPTATTFKVWSPISAMVYLNIYLDGTPRSLKGSDAGYVYKMGYVAGGVWQLTLTGNLAGRFYTFTAINSNGTVEAMDPYAKACGINGMRGYIYDKTVKAEDDPVNAANPAGWDSVPAKWDGVSGYDISTPQDLSIYEIHIRDLTMDESWNGNSQPGTFNAFCEAGTTISGGGKTATTGFDHIEELGVNAVQLVPVFDHDDDERPDKMKFNWGYNPLNYNCVEGGYSSDPYNPLARIREYKNLIKAYSENDNHTRIIMDVVYNHVSSASASCFTKLMPKYYFRYTDKWEYYDGSGCANEVKTDATMMRKYIVDSLCWWATEYKIKGFRFDLMALIDTYTLKLAKEALYAIDPDIYIYGEGWTSGGYHGVTKDIPINDPEHGNTFTIGSANAGDGHTPGLVYSQLYETTASKGQVGGFNNAGRDGLKGGNDDGYNQNPYPQWGFISKGNTGGTPSDVANMLRGVNHWAPGANPRQTVAYASCHDNYTLWDQLRYCLAGSHDSSKHTPSGAPSIEDTVKASLTSHGAVFASNCAAFMQGGEELWRTKSYSYNLDDLNNRLMVGGAEAIVRPYPDYVHYSTDPDVIQATSEVRMYNNEVITHNSYKSPDYVNSFKWDRKLSVDGYDCSWAINIWPKMIKEHAKMPKVDYPTNMSTETTAPYNVWSSTTYDGSSGIALWNGNSEGTHGYYVFIVNRNGASIGVGDSFDYGTIIYEVGGGSKSGGNMNFGPFSIFVSKK